MLWSDVYEYPEEADDVVDGLRLMLELAAFRSTAWDCRRGLFRYDDDMLLEAVSPSAG